jgi:cytochrome c-type biogenesis protein CcmH
MTIWIVIAAMTAVAAAILLLPLVRKGGKEVARLPYDLAVYRDQLDEVARDERRGVLKPEEAASARLEIERRILVADRGADRGAEPAPAATPMRAGKASRAAIILAAAIGPLLALGLYLDRGSPGLPGQPFAERGTNAPGEAPEIDMAKIEGMVAKLAKRLETEPQNLKGWTMLGRSYVMLQRYEDGAAAFARAAGLNPKDAELPASEGEALVYASGGIVTPKARDAFESALAIDPKEPRSRFYLGLASAQAGQPKAALAAWEALAADAPKDAPWLAPLQQQIAKLRESLDSAPKETPREAPKDAPKENPTKPANPGAPQ